MINAVQLYSFFFLIIVILRALFKYQESGPLMYSLILTADIIALVGLFGFSFRKLIFRDWFWKIFVFLFTAVEAMILIRMNYEHFWELLYAAALILPAPYSLVMYAWKTRWDLQNRPARQIEGESHDSDNRRP